MAGILDSLRSLASGAVKPQAVTQLASELHDALEKAPLNLNEFGYDPYGLHPDSAQQTMLPAALLYRYYFRVDTFEIGNVPGGRVLLIANHAGQFAYDGMMLTVAMLLEAKPPRIARGMGEYFLFRLPWVGSTAARMGQMVGTPSNCTHMLENEQCVMVFPEGARGANKPFHKRYQLQRFGQGFMRLALSTDTPIVPVGIVGSEEQQPGFANLEDLGKSLNLPSLPITISSPWLGLAGPMFALPVKYRMYFGDPLYFEGDGDEEDDAIQQRVDVVKDAMSKLLDKGRAERTGIFT
jgi:1-acyl-sn-glycerol-3-phosphate acyltransferase